MTQDSNAAAGSAGAMKVTGHDAMGSIYAAVLQASPDISAYSSIRFYMRSTDYITLFVVLKDASVYQASFTQNITGVWSQATVPFTSFTGPGSLSSHLATVDYIAWSVPCAGSDVTFALDQIELLR